MVFQAYIDDSQDDDGTFVLAGYIASAERWASFSREWERMLPWATVQPDGRHRFKMSEMAMSPERMGRLPAFHTIINNHVEMSIATVIDRKLLNKFLDDLVAYVIRDVNGHKTEVELNIDNVKNVWRDQFFFAYLSLMDTFHKLASEGSDSFNIPGKVDFYFDETSKKGKILRGWDDYLAIRPAEYREKYGATPRFEDDEVFLPLQAADFRAWWVRRWAVEFGPDKASDGKFPFATAAKPIFNLVFYVDERQLKAILAEALGTAITTGASSLEGG